MINRDYYSLCRHLSLARAKLELANVSLQDILLNTYPPGYNERCYCEKAIACLQESESALRSALENCTDLRREITNLQPAIERGDLSRLLD